MRRADDLPQRRARSTGSRGIRPERAARQPLPGLLQRDPRRPALQPALQGRDGHGPGRLATSRSATIPTTASTAGSGDSCPRRTSSGGRFSSTTRSRGAGERRSERRAPRACEGLNSGRPMQACTADAPTGPSGSFWSRLGSSSRRPRCSPGPRLARRRAAGSYDARSFGAKGDGFANDTARDQRGDKGGQRLGRRDRGVFGGHYVSGSIHLRSNVALHLGPGATIVASSDPRPTTLPRRMNGATPSGTRTPATATGTTA